MKKILFTLMILFSISIARSQWIKKSDSPVLGKNATAFSINNLGYYQFSDTTNNFWRYDPSFDTWTKLLDFPLYSWYAVGFAIDNIGYIVTRSSLWAYDVTTNTWKQKADFPSKAYSQAFGFSIGSKGYIGGGGFGEDGSGFDDFWEYDPLRDKWTKKANVGMGKVIAAVGFSINNKGYIGTGHFGGGPMSDEFWEYDPLVNKWTKKANFVGEYRTYATGFAVGGKGYIGAGYQYFGGEKNDLFEYNPSTDSWVQKDGFGDHNGRANATGLAIGNKGYIGLGSYAYGSSGGARSLKDFWEYTPIGPNGLEQISISTFNIFPNPSLGYINVQINNPSITCFTIKNLIGETLLQRRAESANLSIDLSSYARGIYFMEVTCNQEKEIRKIILQ